LKENSVYYLAAVIRVFSGGETCKVPSFLITCFLLDDFLFIIIPMEQFVLGYFFRKEEIVMLRNTFKIAYPTGFIRANVGPVLMDLTLSSSDICHRIFCEERAHYINTISLLTRNFHVLGTLMPSNEVMQRSFNEIDVWAFEPQRMNSTPSNYLLTVSPQGIFWCAESEEWC
jgi:hypothetical protein